MYSKNETFFSADAFENLRLEIYQLDLAKFHLAVGLGWQAPLRTTEEKLKLLTDIDMLLMV